MVDVSAKEITARVATASGALRSTPEVVRLLRADGLPKRDALATARIAGIMAAKCTSDLIPLCHPLPLDSIEIDLQLDDDRVAIVATARTRAATGVEMEALTAVAICALTLHDMVKSMDPAAAVTDVRLERKSGGRSGDWHRAGPT